MLRVLHTSDWHLGQKFIGRSREREHREFLNWLLDTIDKNRVDVLIVAGDIFDTKTPPNYALELYYNFLARLSNTTCKTAIIVAGNHDSISTIQAPKELLRAMNIFVVASGLEPLSERIISLRDDRDNLIGVVCAVPFLRDEVVRRGIANQSYKDRERDLIKGIENHYYQIAKSAKEYIKDNPIPLIATGHLTTLGSSPSDSEREIYIGNSIHIPSAFLEELFDYVALGHLHKPQSISKKVRYSGSPIPLSFGEAKYKKSVSLIEFDGVSSRIEEIEIPIFRKLYSISGSKEEILKGLEGISDLDSFIEVIIDDGDSLKALDDIQDFCDEKRLNLLAKKLKRPINDSFSLDELEVNTLEELSPLDIFKERLKLEGIKDRYIEDRLIELFKSIEDEVATL